MDLREEIDERKRFRKFTHREGPYHTGYNDGIIDTLERLQNCLVGGSDAKPAETYPQAAEDNEYRYIDAGWLDEIAAGLTAGAKKYPGETWHNTPAKEHASRAFRHLNLYRKGDRKEPHLLNASMRCMMAWVMDREGMAQMKFGNEK